MSERTCLVEIPWETRNLGVQSFAVCEEFLENPEEDVLRRALQEKDNQLRGIFVQARLGKKHLPSARCLERSGFYFVESTLVPSCLLVKNQRLSDFACDSRPFVPQRFLLEELRLSLLDKVDPTGCRRVREIAAESFSDDRFHRDPQCGKEVADRRFVFWVDDLLADDAVVFNVLLYREEAIGFMARRGENLVLAGFSAKHVKSGLGDYLWLAVLEDMLQRGFVRVRTLISSSNTAVLNLYARMGFKFEESAATFHYWSR